jgi:ribosomal protein L22
MSADETPEEQAQTPAGEAPPAKAKAARKPAKAKAKATEEQPAAAATAGGAATSEDAPAEDGEGEQASEKKPRAKKAAAEKKPAAEKAKAAKKPSAEKKASAEKKPAAGKKAAAEKTPATKAKAAEAESSAAGAEKEPKPATKAKAAPAAPRRRVVHAHARYVRTSARKARMVCGHLRGKSVQEARAILAFTPREVARDWSKLLESAVANAESNHELLEDDLIVREAYADEGPTIKRFRPRAMGRATPIRKRTSHLTITLSPRA